MKAKYIKPTVIVQKLETEQLLTALSAGASPADPNKPNLSKQYDIIDEEDAAKSMGYSAWD